MHNGDPPIGTADDALEQRVLLVEDDDAFASMVKEVLRAAPVSTSRFVVRRVANLTSALHLLDMEDFDLILLDLNMADSYGMDTLRSVVAAAPLVPVLVVTGSDNDKWVDEAMRSGAQDYLVKARFDLHTLHRAARYAIERSRLQRQLLEAQSQLEHRVAERTTELATTNRSLQREVTERRRAEEQLQETVDQLARSNIELERFAYIASHDLREPLRLVVNYCDLLRRRYGDDLDDQARRYIHYAVESANRLYGMVGSLLEYSRLNVHSDARHPVDCNELVEQVVRELQLPITESHASIEWGLLPTVAGDALLLRQVFQNLIGNALKFRSESPPLIHVGATERPDGWLFSVRDNGIGMLACDADRIFLIFQRLHRAGSYAGAGIGLAVCKKIVEHYGGRIWVESELGRGATFFFTFPAVPQSPVSSSPTPSEP